MKQSTEPLQAPAPGKFTLGQLVATPNALAQIASNADIQTALARHASGDWGDVSPHDRQVNETALKDGSRILSAYVASNGVKFWIITDAANGDGKREVTTVLLPEDY